MLLLRKIYTTIYITYLNSHKSNEGHIKITNESYDKSKMSPSDNSNWKLLHIFNYFYALSSTGFGINYEKRHSDSFLVNLL